MPRDRKIILRNDTAANWTSTNPILAQGEFGVESDTERAKIGDGTSTWTALSYINNWGSGGGGGSIAWGNITGTLSNQTDLQTALDGKADSVHTHSASDVVSGTFADSRIAESNVTQHETALSITESQITDLSDFQDLSFETVNKNLDASNATFTYTNGTLTSLQYTVSSGTITKTLNYTNDVLTSVVLSGDLPPGLSETTKTLSYTNGILTGVSYS